LTQADKSRAKWCEPTECSERGIRYRVRDVWDGTVVEQEGRQEKEMDKVGR
jgi:hypothetical protein